MCIRDSYCSTHPDSVFTQWRMVNRRTEDGNVSITKDQFVRVTPEGKETRTVESEEEFRALLEEHFGICLLYTSRAPGERAKNVSPPANRSYAPI